MNNLRGALLMILAMGGFALEDMFIKKVSSHLPVGQILLFLGFFGTLVFASASLLQRQTLFPPEAFHTAVLLRNGLEIVGTFGIVNALALTTLSSTSAIMQTIPLLVTMGAALFLGETVGWRRWTAILVGFAGMLMIVRPGMAGFEPASLFAVLGAVALAARDLVTPKIPARMSALQVSTWGFSMLVPLGAFLLFLKGGAQPMDSITLWQLTAAVLFGVSSYYTLIVSMRIADLAAVAPFRYSRLLFALALGIAIFGERPDVLTLSGASLIIASGLYTLARERALFSEARQR
ncbi:DMT family transporter [Tropicimonas marinistellae]|uniref:DMT family transporter n=1 Tax=Tropicimonas marinistellae TaxID=1739787 RepID=UPI00082D7794|nr:DMT family transporter [Tropicimonas marinistellae]